MNNYEHLMQGGIDALMEWKQLAIDTCYVCTRSGCSVRYVTSQHSFLECADGQRAWLEAEYKEPDTWERLLEDLDKKYKGSLSNNGRLSNSFISTDYLKGVADRIRALLEVKE